MWRPRLWEATAYCIDFMASYSSSSSSPLCLSLYSPYSPPLPFLVSFSHIPKWGGSKALTVALFCPSPQLCLAKSSFLVNSIIPSFENTLTSVLPSRVPCSFFELSTFHWAPILPPGMLFFPALKCLNSTWPLRHSLSATPSLEPSLTPQKGDLTTGWST